MDKKKKPLSTRRVLLVFVSYLLLIALFVIFAIQIINRMGHGDLEHLRIVIPIALVLPLLLLGVFIFNLIRLFKDIRKNAPGALIKRKMLMYFTAIIFLSIAPMTFISIRTIVNSYKSWYSPQIGSALNSGLYISLLFYHDVIDNLNNFPHSREFQSYLNKIEEDPAEIWDKVSQVNPWIDAIQIYGNGNNQLFGESICERSIEQLEQYREGILPKKKSSRFSVLAYQIPYTTNGITYRIVLSTVLPQDYETEAENITIAVDKYKEYNSLSTYVELATVFMYLFFAMPLVLLSLLLSVLMSERIISPITHLSEATKKIAEGDFSFRLMSRQDDDFSFFIQAFNNMARELQRSRSRMIQTEKVTTWQTIARRLAHELRNPLTPIKLTAQRVHRKAEKGLVQQEKKMVSDSMDLIVRQVEQLDLMLQDFRYFADIREPRKENRDIALFLKELQTYYKDLYPDMEFVLIREDPPIRLMIDAEQMNQALQNILKNSVEACNGKGRISVHVSLVQKGLNRYCRLEILDTGVGLNEEALRQVFQPYYSTRQNGLGLGLPIAERIVTAHDGQIWIESALDAGTTVFIDLPIEEI